MASKQGNVAQIQAILESLTKSQDGNNSSSPLEEGKNSSEGLKTANSTGLEENKTINKTETIKTRVVCAINEKELNKVELAYFKRPLNTVILSDK